jgi:hypothetical protein
MQLLKIVWSPQEIYVHFYHLVKPWFIYLIVIIYSLELKLKYRMRSERDVTLFQEQVVGERKQVCWQRKQVCWQRKQVWFREGRWRRWGQDRRISTLVYTTVTWQVLSEYNITFKFHPPVFLNNFHLQTFLNTWSSHWILA